jgi:hypothetical protein
VAVIHSFVFDLPGAEQGVGQWKWDGPPPGWEGLGARGLARGAWREGLGARGLARGAWREGLGGGVAEAVPATGVAG